MKHLLSQLEQTLLCGAARDLRLLLAEKRIPGCDRTASFYGLRQAVADAKAENLVRLAPTRWIGHPPETASESTAISRAYVGLEKRGLVERAAMCMGGERCTHLMLTAAGIALAAEFEQEAAADG